MVYDVVVKCSLREEGVAVRMVRGMPDHLILRMAASLIGHSSISSSDEVRSVLDAIRQLVNESRSNGSTHLH